MKAKDKSCITPFKDLMENALKDYDEASKLAHHFNSDIPKAIIKFYTDKVQPVELQEPKNYCTCGDQQDTEDIFETGKLITKCNHCGEPIQPKETADRMFINVKAVDLIGSWKNDPKKQPTQTPDTSFRTFLNSKAVFTWDKIDMIVRFVEEYSQSQQPKVTNRTIERDMAVIYENYLKDNNIKDSSSEFDLLHGLYAKLYCEVSFPEQSKFVENTENLKIHLKDSIKNKTYQKRFDIACDFPQDEVDLMIDEAVDEYLKSKAK